jgi:hypothetical protein
VNTLARWWHADDARGLWATTAITLIFAVAATMPLTPHDLWFHIRLGQQMLDTRALVTTDIFSYTQYGATYFNNAWLGELVLYGLWAVGGAPLLVFARALCVVCFYAMFWWLGWRASGSERWSAWFILLAALASFPHWQLRPQTFVLPIFALFVFILTRYLERGRAPLFWLPLLMIAWVNLHGSFVFGFALVALTLAGEMIQATLTRAQAIRLAMWAALTGAAMLINPLGFGMFAAVLEIGRDPAIQGWVLEWLPANAREFPANVFYGMVLALLLGALFSRVRGRATEMLWGVTFIWLGWSAYRNALWATALMVPLLAMLWTDLGAQIRARVPIFISRWTRFLFYPRRLGAMRALILIVLLMLCLIALPLPRAAFSGNDLRWWVSADTPIDAVSYLRENNVRERIYHEIGAGSFLMWALWPQQLVFVDSRINLYTAEQWRDYFAVLSAQDGFEDILAKYRVEYVLADSFWQPQLVEALHRRERSWQLVFQSGESFLFRRR